jgi:hypothetical protein
VCCIITWNHTNFKDCSIFKYFLKKKMVTKYSNTAYKSEITFFNAFSLLTLWSSGNGSAHRKRFYSIPLRESNVSVARLTLLLPIQELQDWNTSPDTTYPDWGLSRFPSVITDKYWDSTLKESRIILRLNKNCKIFIACLWDSYIICAYNDLTCYTWLSQELLGRQLTEK